MILLRDKIEKTEKKVYSIDARQSVEMDPERFEIVDETTKKILDADKKAKRIAKENRSKEQSEKMKAQIANKKKENEELEKLKNEEEPNKEEVKE